MAARSSRKECVDNAKATRYEPVTYRYRSLKRGGWQAGGTRWLIAARDTSPTERFPPVQRTSYSRERKLHRGLHGDLICGRGHGGDRNAESPGADERIASEKAKFGAAYVLSEKQQPDSKGRYCFRKQKPAPSAL